MLTPIIILCLLTLPLSISWLLNKTSKSPAPLNVARYACIGLGICFIFFAIGHLLKTQGMIEMLPAWIPFRSLIIYATGVLELAIGLALIAPSLQLHAAKLAIAVFIVFFPANIYAALQGVGLGGHQWGAIYLLIRAPLQLILIGWAYFLCINKNE
ncbi:MAG: hypothetical protein MJK10_12845 [Pseudomonadales bacterium]|nr:hypothetical protein [Pseudomonadales bacterium]NRA16892.1 hypothetical protein [Oceanospirillaceae bacterium]